MRSRCLLAFALLLTMQVELHAAGFDKSYQVYQGDLAPADGLIDLYVKGTGPAPIMLDDLFVIVPSPVVDFALKNNGSGTFDVVESLTNAQRSAARTWAQAGAGIALRDVDFNGATDLMLEDLSAVVGGAFDQTIFASPQRGRAPLHLTAHNANYQSYHRDLARWLVDPAYFTNVPLKVVSIQPPTPIWYAASPEATDYGLIFRIIADCQQRNPSSTCGYTSIDPTSNTRDPEGCIRSVVLVDPITLEPVGADVRNVCEYDAHVYVYIPGSVTVHPDESVFNEDAKESAVILEDFRENCTSVPAGPADRLGDILSGVYGADIWGPQGTGPANVTNGFPHPPFPGDESFDPTDLTFHHYDVVTEICSIGTSGCDSAHLENLLRWYSYPSKRLQPVWTQVDYDQRLWAYITLAPLGPHSYIIPAGEIKQRFVTPPFGSGAVQNVTQDNHLVFPGAITRVIRVSPSWIDVITHGIGINRAFCTHYSPSIPVQVLIGWANDVFGQAAFRTLDRQMKKFFQSNPVGLPSGSSGPGSEKPEFQLDEPAVFMADPAS